MNIKLSFLRFFMRMAAIMMAAMSFTACLELENDNDENEGGGDSGKRLKTVLLISPDSQDMRTEYSYNSDGTLNRYDNYLDASTTHFLYCIITNNSDGTMARHELHQVDIPMITVSEYTYDNNKKPLKMEGSSLWDSNVVSTITVDFTFQSGRKTREVQKSYAGMLVEEVQRVFNYDGNGRRTTVVETSNGKTRQITRTYRSDGTLEKVTYPDFDNTMTYTHIFTWENGKTTFNWEDFMVY